MKPYFKAPPGWTPSDTNPFSSDGTYGPEWICFFIDPDNPKIEYCGAGKTGLFTICRGGENPVLRMSLADFLRYEEGLGKKVILSCPDSIDDKILVEQALLDTPGESTIRPTDPLWAVHSTTLEAWKEIRRDGMLKSLALLREEGKQASGIGMRELGEPPDYAEYVVLGRIDEYNAEHVVASRGKGGIVTEPDEPYQPGVRLYFDLHRLIRNGLAVRDGLHLAKVRDSLSLSLMKGSVCVDEFPGQIWTPRTFCETANQKLMMKLKERQL